MMLAKLCVVFVLKSGIAVPGEALDGWHCLPLPTLEVCEKRRAFAQRVPLKMRNVRAAHWHCYSVK